MKLSDVTQSLGLTDPPPKEEEKGFKTPPGPKKVYLEWVADSRSEVKPLGARFMRTLTVVAIFLGFLLILMREWALILVSASIFLVYKALSQTPPGKVTYSVTNHGVLFDGHLYPWDELKNYFLKKSDDLNVLVISTKFSLPGRIYLTYKQKDEKTLVDSIGQYLIYLEEEPKTAVDNIYEKVIDKFNLD